MNIKITIIKNSKLDKIKGLRKNFYIFLRYLYYKYVKKISNPKVYHYNFDGIATTHNCDFMKNDNFVRSYSRAKKVFDFEFETTPTILTNPYPIIFLQVRAVRLSN